MPAVLEAVVQGLAAAAPAIVSMPVSATIPVYGYFGPHGLAGQRTFRRSFDLELSHYPGDLLAMLGGTLAWLEPGTDVGPPQTRGDGTSAVYRTAQPALLLTVDPGGAILGQARGVLDDLAAGAAGDPAPPGYPLDLPLPHYVVYEGDGITIADGLVPPRVEIFEGFPEELPEPGTTFADLFSDTVAGRLPAAARADWQTRLDAIRERLLGDPALDALLIGHVDSVGTEDAELGVRRAELLRTALGLPANRTRTRSRGAAEPLYTGTAMDAASRRLNRRVEVVVSRLVLGAASDNPRRDAPRVAAGAVIGRTSGPISVLVLDAAGRFHDPLDVVRRYDREGRFAEHWRTTAADVPRPAIASGWVRVITPPGASDGAEPALAPFFTFRALDPVPGDDPRLTDAHLGGVEAADVVWLPAVRTARCQLTIGTPLTLLGAGPPVDLLALAEDDPRPVLRGIPTADPGPFPTEPDPPPDTPRMLTFRSLQDPDGVGVRILGIRIQGADVGAVAVLGEDGAPLDRHDGTRPSVHVSTCYFGGNTAAGRRTGGALHLDTCGGVLIEACVFRTNAAQHGGAVYAEGCRHVVVEGTPLLPEPEAQFESRRLDLLPPPDPAGGPRPTLHIESGDLHRTATGSCFDTNTARGAGGALALVDTRFHVVNTWFIGNQADEIGGAIAAARAEPDADRLRALARPGDAWPRCDRSAIVHCVSDSDQAVWGGGAIALVGPGDGLLVGAFGPAFDVDGTPSPPAGPADGGICQIHQNLIVAANSFAREGNPQGAPALPPRDDHTASLGGAVLLAGGLHHLRGNRLQGNTGDRCGGAVAAVAGTRLFLEDNTLDLNATESHVPEGAVLLRGGGAIYAHGRGADGPTRVWLSGNRVRDNAAGRRGDGGALLAACGAVVLCARATASTANSFFRNRAAWNGGAIAVRNAELEVGAGEAFEENRADTGDGGALYAAGARIGVVPEGTDLYQASVEAAVTPPCGQRGTRLALEGAPAEPVLLRANRAALEGGALAVYQQPAPPILPPAPDAPRSTVVDRTVGLVRTVTIRHALLRGNASGEEPIAPVGPPPIVGSTIVLQDLDHGWRAAFTGVTFRTAPGQVVQGPAERDQWIGADALGESRIEDLRIELDRGTGILAIRSDSVDVDPPAVTVTNTGGDPEGTSWQRVRAADVARPVVP
jgi:hypothetical protein